MITLDTSTRKLEVKMGGAATSIEPHCTVVYRDVPKKTKDDFSDYITVTNLVKTSGASDVTLVAAPPVNTAREILHICIHNADSVTQTITVKIDDGTEYHLIANALATLKSLVYENEQGWQVI